LARLLAVEDPVEVTEKDAGFWSSPETLAITALKSLINQGSHDAIGFQLPPALT
jgi:hypothetical protein